jgi:hypothetical protein
LPSVKLTATPDDKYALDLFNKGYPVQLKKHVIISAAVFLGLNFLPAAQAAQQCVPQYSTKELCVMPSADMSRVHESPEVLLAAQVVAKKLKPYLPAGVPYVMLTMGYRSPAEQQRIRRTGVRAGPASGKFVSAHIYGVALDVQINSRQNFAKEMCAALNQVMSMLKNKGGVIMEGSGGGSTNGHIDDNWGARFSMAKTGQHKSLNYTGGDCTESYGVTGASGEQFKEMAKITAASLESHAAAVEGENADGEDEGEGPEDDVMATKQDGARMPSSWKKFH